MCTQCPAQHSKAVMEKSGGFLTPAEEHLLCQYFMKKLLEFCNHFQPPIPKSALVRPVMSILHGSCMHEVCTSTRDFCQFFTITSEHALKSSSSLCSCQEPMLLESDW